MSDQMEDGAGLASVWPPATGRFLFHVCLRGFFSVFPNKCLTLFGLSSFFLAISKKAERAKDSITKSNE